MSRSSTITEQLLAAHGLPTKRRPATPGAILRREFLDELPMTQKELAKRLGVSARLVSQVVNERRPVDSELALRLARVLGTTAELWLGLQQAVAMWDAITAKASHVKKLRPIAQSRLLEHQIMENSPTVAA
ncbi:HigA family addiction module antitoxin [Nannocystis punicea]|uniref:HigA family addiction module antitoxin n=1 Tax=Nannocystis punicea TaxID=2995304 RepID=A0ABY7HD33_9BACT|nr:HigA family addiction module antitoxin [Nannocystis poenicansa]WAS97200.1 HigA family addiction module antitoxin [Nannocystis poenicansa]